MGGIGPTALRASKSEKLLEGQAPDDGALQAAGQAASEASDPPDDIHGSAEISPACRRGADAARP